MKGNKKTMMFGVLAFAVVFFWGITFVSFTVTLRYFTPAQIMFLRCVIAYVSLWIVYPKAHKSEGWRQELKLLGAGACGTTLYIVLSNTALTKTATSNVSVLSSLSPIFTALLAPLFIKNAKILKRVMIGFVIAFVGAFLVTTGGDFSLHLSFLGDGLAICSAISWAVYSLILRKIDSQYSQMYITRRIFLYGIITVIPVLLIQGTPIDVQSFKNPTVIFNLLFLGLVAYTCCHVGWGFVIRNMGSVWTSQFTYLTPIVTMIASALILGDKISIYMIMGTVLILGGVMVSDGKFSRLKEKEKEIVEDVEKEIENEIVESERVL